MRQISHDTGHEFHSLCDVCRCHEIAYKQQVLHETLNMQVLDV